MIRRSYRRRNPGANGLQLSPTAGWLTAQACAIGLLVMAAGAVAGAIGAVAYELVKGFHLE